MSANKSVSDPRVEARLVDWLREGPDEAPTQGLERALSAAHAVSQRPRAAFPSTWLPRSVADIRFARPHLGGVPILIILGLLVMLAMMTIYIGSRPHLPESLGPARDTLVAFSNGKGEIYVARVDGSARRQVNGEVANAHSPVFSPDGSRLAFISDESALQPMGGLYVVSLKGSKAPIDVSHGVSVLAADAPEISWSPDGTAIAFAGTVIRETPSAPQSGTGASIFVAQADGSGVEQITDDTMDRDQPVWSTLGDGDRIAYRAVEADGERVHLEYVRPDGSDVSSLTTVIGPGADLSGLAWSPANDIDVHFSYVASFGFGTPSKAMISGGHDWTPWSDGIGGLREYGVPWSPDGRWMAILTASDGLVLAEFDPNAPGGTLYAAFDYPGELRHLGNVADCWIDWSPDGTALYGGSPDGCTGTVVIPVDDPDSAFITYTPMSGVTSWQPLEP